MIPQKNGYQVRKSSKLFRGKTPKTSVNNVVIYRTLFSENNGFFLFITLKIKIINQIFRF